MQNRELLKGSASMLVLKMLDGQPRYGNDIARELEKRAGTVLFDPHSDRVGEIFANSDGVHKSFSFRTFMYCAVKNAESAKGRKYVTVVFPFSSLEEDGSGNDGGRISQEEFLVLLSDYYARVSVALRSAGDMRGVIDLAFDIQCMEFTVSLS